MTPDDPHFMALALAEARAAAAAGEVPIGAVAVKDGQVVAAARNRVESQHSVTAHAELELLHLLEQQTGDWRMSDYTIYVTKEPCPMCAGALVNARVKRIVFGVPDPAFGGCGGAFAITGHPGALWQVECTGNVEAEAARALLQEFFRTARKRNVRS